MKQPLIKKLVIVAVVLIAFIAYLQYNKYQETHYELDPAAFNVKDTLKEVKSVQNEQFRGLASAEKYDVVEKLDKTITFAKLNRNVVFHEAWLGPEGMYILYSTNILKMDKALKDVPKLMFSQSAFQMDDGQSFHGFYKGDNQPKGQTFHHRVYRGLYIFYEYGEMRIKEEENIEKILSKVTAFTLEKAKMQTKKSEWDLDQITLPVSYNADKRLIQSIPIHRSIAIDKTTKITFNTLKRFVDKSTVDYQLETTNKNVTRVVFQFAINGKQKSSNNAVFQLFAYTNTQTSSVPLLVSKPASLTITPMRYSYMSEKQVSFELNKSDIQKARELGKNQKDIKVADIDGGSVYFGYEDHQLLFRFEVENTTDKKLDYINAMTQTFYNALNESDDYRKRVTIFSLKNGKGKELKAVINGVDSDQASQTITLGLRQGDFTGDHLSVTINHIPYIKEVDGESVEIPVN